ncbi:MAG: hypothetical protein ACP5HM_10600 [Anaerolineae bacterium]
MRTTLSWLLVSVLLWSACTTVQTPTDEVPVEQLVGTSPPPTSALTSPLESKVPSFDPTAEAMAETLKSKLAAELGIDAGALELLSAETVEWRDASLGCPQPGKVYAQVITPGWHFVFEDAAGRIYDVRAPREAESFIICEPTPKPNPTPPEEGEAPAEVIEAAKRLVAERKGVPETALTVARAEAVEWRNACLGCAGPDEMCAMVMTPGYRLVLQAGDISYTVHTNKDGTAARICEGAGGGAVRPPVSEDVPREIWLLHEEVLGFLGKRYPGFGLAQLPPIWEGKNVTEPGKLGAETYRFVNGSWALVYLCPVIPEPECDVDLRHDEAGRLWQGAIGGAGPVVERKTTPTLTYEVGACDESLTGEVLAGWAGATITPTKSGFDFVHRIPYVCCADIVAAAGLDAETQSVRIVETNQGEVCRCMCGYEMRGRVTGLAADRYTVEFWGVQKPGIHPLEQLANTIVEVSGP